MDLDELESALLVAISRLTSGTQTSCDGIEIAGELDRMGVRYDPGVAKTRLMEMREAGLLSNSSYFGFGMDLDESVGPISLSWEGRQIAREVDRDGFERSTSEITQLVSSDAFSKAFPDAYEAWRNADEKLRSPEASKQIAAIGSDLRVAQQRFATGLIDTFPPLEVDTDRAKVKRRVGAVIAARRENLGEKHRAYLESLGDLWSVTTDLIQRLVHAEEKQDEPVSLAEAHSAVFSMLYLMYQLVVMIEMAEPPENLATLETNAPSWMSRL